MDTFLTRARREREALKCAPHPNTQRQYGRPLIRAWLRVASPSVLPFPLVTASQMATRSPSPAPPHAKRRCKSKSVATFPAGATGGGGCAAIPAATTPYSAAAKFWMVASDRPNAPRPASGGGMLRYPPTPGAPHLTVPIAGEGGWGWYLPAPGPPWGGGVGGGLGVCGVGDGSNPKGLLLYPLPVEVWGYLPPGAIHR